MMKNLFENKEIVNPLNTEEVFSCESLTEDYWTCRKEKRMQTSKLAKKMSCAEYRNLGKSISPSNMECSQQVLLFGGGRVRRSTYQEIRGEKEVC